MVIEAKEWVDRFSLQVPELSLEEMMEDMLWYIQNYDWVTLVELCRRYGDQAKGDHSLMSNENMVLWVGMSDKLCSALLGLLKDRLVHLHGASYLAYLVDGGVLKLPFARRPPKQGYNKPHWLPVCFRAGPKCMLKDCPSKIKIKKGSV